MIEMSTTLRGSPILQLAAEISDLIDELPEAATLGTFAIIYEINSDGYDQVFYRCSDERRWIQAGLFRHGEHVVRETSQVIDEDEEE